MEHSTRPEIDLVKRRSVLAGYAMRVLRNPALLSASPAIDSAILHIAEQERATPEMSESERLDFTCYDILRSMATAWRTQSKIVLPKPRLPGTSQIYKDCRQVIQDTEISLKYVDLDRGLCERANTAPDRKPTYDENMHLDELIQHTWYSQRRIIGYTKRSESPLAYEQPLSIRQGGATHLLGLMEDLPRLYLALSGLRPVSRIERS